MPAQVSYIIQRKFQKIQRKFWKSVFWHFKLLNIFKICLMALVFIPEVLTDLLTPILPYLYLTCVRWHMRQIWHFWHFWHKWHIWYLTFVMSSYGNMGVKRGVLTSGTQTNALKQLVHRFNGLKFKNTDFRDFPLYFLRFPLYNWCGLCYVPIRFHEKFL